MKIVSFDFDGVLHSDVTPSNSTNHPTPSRRNKAKQLIKYANWDIIDCIKNNTKRKIYVLTGRDEWEVETVKEFLKLTKIDNKISRILLTNDKPKSAFINRHGISLHVEDSPKAWRDIKKNTKAKLVRVVY